MSFMTNDEGVRLTQIPKDYSDGLTKQSFKDSTDINKLLRKAQKTGTLSHLQQFSGQYGDFSDFDFQTAQVKLAEANSIFEKLPSEIRREFSNNAGLFFEYANDPANVNRLAELLPGLAEPGNQAPAVIRTAATERAAEVLEAKQPPAAPPAPAGPPDEPGPP